MAEQEYTPAWRVFHEYFHVRIPAMYANQNRQQMVGSPVYEDKSMNEQAAQEMVHKQHTIAELAELNDKGCQIIIHNPKDSLRIYTLIQEHLEVLHGYYRNSINSGKVPISDIQKLDELAAAVYGVTRQHENIDTRGSASDRHLRSMRASRLFSNRVDKSVDRTAEKSKTREHRPITQDIQKTIIDRNLKYE